MTSDALFQYHYFEKLEILIKKGSAAYLLIFITGTLILLIDPATFVAFLTNHSFESVLSIALFLTGGFYGLYYLVSHFGWISEIHLRMDKMFLGFLIKSNDVIYTTLISALPDDDQLLAVGLAGQEREKLIQSIFSRISNDNNLFDLLRQSAIFRFWMSYWIFLYGIFTFTLLTVLSFAAVVLRTGLYDKTFFTISWFVALLHVGLSMLLGKYLIRIMISTVGQIVDTHKDTIAQIVREHLPGSSNRVLFRAEDASYEDLR